MEHFDLLPHYFPELNTQQLYQFKQLYNLYTNWNERVNVISRKDIDKLFLHHILHSLSIAKFISFKPKTRIVDIGTGGGFPGIPLAIFFPEVDFYLVDSINKKITVVNDIIKAVNIKNAEGYWGRVEDKKLNAHFFVTRAVAPLADLVSWCKKEILPDNFNDKKNGLIALKGGDLFLELQPFKNTQVVNLSDYFKEDFFETKRLVYQPI